MKWFIALATALLLVFVPVSAAAAYNPLGAACTGPDVGAGADSSACTGSQSTGNPIFGPGSVLEKVTFILATIAGIAAIIIIIVAGLRFITANGNAQQVSGARSAIINTLVGLIIIVAAASIITFVISKI